MRRRISLAIIEHALAPDVNPDDRDYEQNCEPDAGVEPVMVDRLRRRASRVISDHAEGCGPDDPAGGIPEGRGGRVASRGGAGSRRLDSRREACFRWRRPPMRVGVPRETAVGERRVALVPDAAGRLEGFDVAVERGAGEAAGFPDDAYVAA